MMDDNVEEDDDDDDVLLLAVQGPLALCSPSHLSKHADYISPSVSRFIQRMDG